MLLSYAKIALQHELLESAVPDEPQLAAWLTGYFPPLLRERFAGDIAGTACAGRSSRSGSPMPSSTAAARRWRCGWPRRRGGPRRRGTAFLAAREVFELPRCGSGSTRSTAGSRATRNRASIEATQGLVNAQTLWFLRDGAALTELGGTIARHKDGRPRWARSWRTSCPRVVRQAWSARRAVS